MKALRIGGVVLLVLVAAAVAGVGIPETAGGAESSPTEGITVTGTGTAQAVPNEAQFSLGVTTKGGTAREALAANSARMERVIAALKGAGVSDKDIKTQDVSVGLTYDEKKGSPTGYAARNSVSVRVRELDQSSSVLDAASRAGANEVYGPSLTRSNREAYEARALESAFGNARKRAEALADAAGVKLGRVSSIVEGFNGGPQPMWEAARAAKTDTVGAPVEAGTEEIQASVTVTFAIE
jgi:uncharacterized protein YggE